MRLELDTPALDKDERSLALSLERERAIQQGTVSFESSDKKVDQLADGAMRCLSTDEQAFIKKAIGEFGYKKCGNFANVQHVDYDVQKNQVSATINFVYEINLDLDELGFSKFPEAKELLGQVQVMESAHQQLEKNCHYLDHMINKAIGYRENEIDRREQEIDEACHGVKGLWNKLTGQVPEPIPSLEEAPLTKRDLKDALYVLEAKTDSFLNFLDEHYSDIRKDASASLKNLENLVQDSAQQMENLTIQAKEAVSDIPIVEESRAVTDGELDKLLSMSNKELKVAMVEMSDDQYLAFAQKLNNEDIEKLMSKLAPMLETTTKQMQESMATVKSSEMRLKELTDDLEQSWNNNIWNAIKDLGKSESSITHKNNDGESVTEVFRNPTASDLSSYLSYLPNGSITDITFFGHGRSSGIEINTKTNEALMSAGDLVMLEGDNFINLVQEKLKDNATINLEGCNTARWSDNIARTTSEQLPNATVKGYRGYGFSNMLFGGSSRVGISKAYKQGEE